MGIVGDAVRRIEEESVAVGDLRTRLRCERVGVSRPEDLCHLGKMLLCVGLCEGFARGGCGTYRSAEVI